MVMHSASMPTETSVFCRVRQRTMTKPRAKKEETKQLTSQKSQESKEKRVPSSIHRCRAQIVALKRNNKSLANALDEARQDYRLLQSEDLLLREERQLLLERVAKLEKGSHQTALEVKPAVAFLCEAIQDIEALHEKAQQAKRNIKGIRFPAVHTQNVQTLSPIVDASGTSKGRNISEAPEKGTSNGVYPKTPHPLCVSSTDSHPCFASTPVGTDSHPISVGLIPGAIQFSESETSGSIVHCRSSQITTSNKRQQVSPTEANQPPSSDSSPGLPESGDREDSALQKGSVSDYLDSTADVQRPKRRCASLSTSYQEPSLSKKLRRGDPFTTTTTGWNPSGNRKKNKKKTGATVSRKAISTKILQQRRVLQNMTNKM